MNSDPMRPIKLSAREEYLYNMWVFFKNSISPREYKKNQERDIKAVLEIEEAMQDRQDRRTKIEKEMNMVKKW